MRHLLDKHILIVTAFVTILGGFGGTLEVIVIYWLRRSSLHADIKR